VEGAPPCARYGHSATMVNNGTTMIVVGGQDKADQYNDVWALSMEPYVWTAVNVDGVPPCVREKHTCTLVGDKLLLVGGFTRAKGDQQRQINGDAFTLKLSADSSSGSWEPFEVSEGTLPTARTQHAAVCVDNAFVYIFGGYTGEKVEKDMWIIDVKNKSAAAVKVQTGPEPRSRHSCHLVGSMMWVFCGYDVMKPHPADVYTTDCDDAKGALIAGLEAAAASEKDKKDKEAKPDEEDDE